MLLWLPLKAGTVYDTIITLYVEDLSSGFYLGFMILDLVVNNICASGGSRQNSFKKLVNGSN
ncbi:hypothetical protein YC2023_059528 [Brassica napus]